MESVMAHEYDAAEVDRQFDWGLKNKASSSGKTRRAASIIFEARKLGYMVPPNAVEQAFRFVPVDQLKCRAPSFLVDSLIETDTLGMVFGDPGCGKSFFAVDLALSVATGTPFHGWGVKQGSVFFIAGEGHNGLARRFHAWSTERGVSLKGVPLFKSERAAQFLDAASAVAVAQAVDQMADQFGQPSLIIVDTVARNFGPGDENSTSDMGAFIAAIDDLKARYPGCAVLLVHHSGHADKQRARGAMALKGALDCEFRIEKNESGLHIHCTKMKDADTPPTLHFELKTVQLDASTTSAVLHAIEAPERQTRLTPSQRLGIETYKAAAEAGGVWTDGTFMGVLVEEWRSQFYTKHTGDTPDAKRKAFLRVRNDLVKSGHIHVNYNVYWLDNAGFKIDISLHRDKQDIAGHSLTCPATEVGESGTDGTNAYRHVPCPAPTVNVKSAGSSRSRLSGVAAHE
jgi:hypothetical protein